jgi:hypothetical protein
MRFLPMVVAVVVAAGVVGAADDRSEQPDPSDRSTLRAEKRFPELVMTRIH